MSGRVEDVDVVRIPTRNGRVWEFVALRDDDGVRGHGETSDSGGDVTADLADVLGAVAGMPVDGALRLVEEEVARAVDADSLRRVTALGGVETALCDVAARRAGVPLATWLGGTDARPEPVRMYANVNRSIDRPDAAEFADAAVRAVAAGFGAVKCAPFDRVVDDPGRAVTGLALAEAVRSAIGPDVELMVDVHFHLSPRELRQIASGLADLDLRWLEDAIPLADVRALADVKAAVGAPIAGGELLASARQVAAAVRAGVCDVVMPDVKYSGGVRGALAYARGARQLGAEVSLHNPSGPIATAASAHVSQCVDASWLEYAFGELPGRAATVIPEEPVRGGTYPVPDGPGLGLDLAPTDVQAQPPTRAPVRNDHGM